MNKMMNEGAIVFDSLNQICIFFYYPECTLSHIELFNQIFN